MEIYRNAEGYYEKVDEQTFPSDGTNTQSLTLIDLEPETNYNVCIFINIEGHDRAGEANLGSGGLYFTTEPAPTGIDEINVNTNLHVRKLLHRGRVIIIRDGQAYDITGQRLQ